jgi:hypothetical protein
MRCSKVRYLQVNEVNDAKNSLPDHSQSKLVVACLNPIDGGWWGSSSHHPFQEHVGIRRPGLPRPGRAHGQDKRAQGQSTSIHTPPEVPSSCAAFGYSKCPMGTGALGASEAWPDHSWSRSWWGPRGPEAMLTKEENLGRLRHKRQRELWYHEQFEAELGACLLDCGENNLLFK